MNSHLALRSVSATVDGAPILHDLSVEAHEGEFVGIIGPNGAGKTTLLRIMAGLLAPAAGIASINDETIATLPARRRARMIAYLPQIREVYWNVSVEVIVALGRYAYGTPERLGHEDRDAVFKAMDMAGIAHLKGRRVATLSGGETARVHFARTLAGQTPVLIADEPAANLDPAQQIAIMTLLAGRAADGGLAIAALHDVALAKRFCSRIIALKDGRLAGDGATSQILNAAFLNSLFGIPDEFAMLFGANGQG